MRVSVIIPTYNRKDVLELVLKSLAQQTYDPKKYEVIVVDDGGSDGTDKMVKTMAKAVHFKLCYLYQERKGPRSAAARNLGIRNAKGDVLIFIDSDIVVMPSFIEEHVKSHESQDDLIVIGYSSGQSLNLLYKEPPYHSAEEIRKLLDGDWQSVSKDIKIIPEFRELYYRECSDNLMHLKKPWKVLHTNNVSVRAKNALELDECFVGWGVHDIELGYCYYRNGLSFVLNRKALGLHIESDADYCPYRKPSLKNWREQAENLRLFALKHKDNDVWELCWNEYHNIPPEAKPEGRIELRLPCNNNCFYKIHCSCDAQEGNVSLSAIRKQLEDLQKKLIDRVVITGGDPLLHPNILDILKWARSRGIDVVLETNGRAFAYASLTKKAVSAGLKSVRIRYWGHHPLVFDFLTQSKGSHEQTEQGIANLRREGVKVEITVPVVPQNIVFLPKILERLSALGVEDINFDWKEETLRRLGPSLKERVAQLEENLIGDIPPAIKQLQDELTSFSEEQSSLVQPPRVAILGYPTTVMEGDRLGGTERETVNLKQVLKKKGMDSTIFARTGETSAAHPLVVPLETGSLAPVSQLGKEYEHAAQTNLDYYWDFAKKSKDSSIVHGINSSLLAVLSERPVVIDIHCPIPLPEFDSLEEAYRTSQYLVHSQYMKRWLEEAYPSIPDSHIHVVYNSVDTEIFRPLQTKKKGDAFTFLFCSAWVKKKGIFTFLDSIDILRKVRKDFRVLLAGTPYLYNNGEETLEQKRIDRQVRAAAKRLGNVEVIGLIPYEKLPEVYNSVDAVVFPSEWEEPFGLVVIEALACGTPVIATRVGGIPEILKKYPQELLVKPRNPKQLSEAMSCLMDKNNIYKFIKKESREIILENFDKKKYATEIERTYLQLLKEASSTKQEVYEINGSKRTISLFGPNKKVHEKITQKRGSFNETVEQIKNLLNTGRDILVDYHLHDDSMKNLESLPKLVDSLGLKRIRFTFLGNPRNYLGRHIESLMAAIKLLDDKGILIRFEKYGDIISMLYGKPLAPPQKVVLEVHNECNLRCSYCWTHSPTIREKIPHSFLSDSLPIIRILSILRELARIGVPEVEFCGVGEPLMHPQIFTAINEAKRLGIKVRLATNGACLSSNQAAQLVSLGVDRIKCHMSAGSEEKYAEMHNAKPHVFNVLKRNLKIISDTKKELHTYNPFLIILSVICEQNIKQIPQIIDVAHEVGADFLEFRKVWPHLDHQTSFTISDSSKEWLLNELPNLKKQIMEKKLVTNIDELVQFLNRPIIESPRQAGDVPCTSSWRFSLFSSSGALRLCARGHHPPVFWPGSFSEYWHSQDLQKFRDARLRHFTQGGSLCVGCNHTTGNDQSASELRHLGLWEYFKQTVKEKYH